MLDAALICFGYVAGILVVYAYRAFFNVIPNFFIPALITGGVYFVVFWSFGVYKTLWKLAGTKDYLRLMAAGLLSAVIVTVIFIFYSADLGLIKISIAASIFSFMLICFLRFFIRGFYRLVAAGHGVTHDEVPTLIIGAGSMGALLLRDIAANRDLPYDIVGLVDDDPNKLGMRVRGIEVLGGRGDIARLCREYNIEVIILAIVKISVEEKSSILDICSDTGCNVKVMSGLDEILDGNSGEEFKLRDVSLEDLLSRSPVTLDNALIDKNVSGKTVLVTGGGGSIGSELCRQIMKHSPKSLVIFDIYENNAYEIERELRYNYPDADIAVLIGSVRDRARLDVVFETHKPQIVFHAAAHKHVPLMETSPGEAIKNNILGTYHTALCAKEHKTETFILISTDKAVNPTNVMGASKRVCEMIIQLASQSGETKFAAVRFGNVLGSNGSVIPLFMQQIQHGGPVTVTHRDITRFFMTIPEAVQLVLQAASYSRGGEIFILDMGKPVRIYDLAEKMVRLSGYRPGEDIKIEITGLRPGEKLYEELLMDGEKLPTENSKIFIGKVAEVDEDELMNVINRLQAVEDASPDMIRMTLRRCVPTYTPEYRTVVYEEEMGTDEEAEAEENLA
jgi:FlaA1/EpsC-like NDP-sugar epimerase